VCVCAQFSESFHYFSSESSYYISDSFFKRLQTQTLFEYLLLLLSSFVRSAVTLVLAIGCCPEKHGIQLPLRPIRFIDGVGNSTGKICPRGLHVTDGPIETFFYCLPEDGQNFCESEIFQFWQMVRNP